MTKAKIRKRNKQAAKQREEFPNAHLPICVICEQPITSGQSRVTFLLTRGHTVHRVCRDTKLTVQRVSELKALYPL